MFSFSNERDPVPVSQEPIVHPKAWRALRRPGGEMHLTLALQSGSLRTTSEIMKVDAESKSLFTASGRCYKLEQPPASDLLMLAMLGANAVRVGLGNADDVSDRLWIGLNGGETPPESTDPS